MYKSYTNRFKLGYALIITMIFGMPTAASANPPTQTFPADAGVINVKDYGAAGDGVADDTAALLKAIRAADTKPSSSWWRNRIVYFPPGTYLVSDTLSKRASDGSFQSGMVLIGASRDKTRLRLKNRAPGYGDTLFPKAMIFTSSTLLRGLPTAGGKDYVGKGEGNDAYANYVENMTLDVGEGNPGAIAIDYVANNSGALRNLSIEAPASSGAIGISLDRKWPGPALLSNVSIDGFDIGISASHFEYGVTLDKITLSRQRKVALHNNGNSLAINDLTVHGDSVGINNIDVRGLITGTGLYFTGRLHESVAISNRGTMTLRNVRTLTRAQILGAVIPANGGVEGVFEGHTRTHSATPPWELPVKSSPSLPIGQDPAAVWANVQHYGAVADGQTDSGAAIQRALNSGASTIYFPFGSYVINDTLEVPPTVRRIEGMMSSITVNRYNSVAFWQGAGIFRVTGAGEPMVIQRLSFDMVNKGGKLAIEHSGSVALTLRDVVAAGISLIDRKVDGGELFVENVCCGAMRFSGPNGVWMRQLNTEGEGVRITNNESPLWILGIKTEQNATVVASGPGATTEVLGGLIYLVHVPTTQRPAFITKSAQLFASFVEASYLGGAVYDVLLLDQTPGAEHSAKGESASPRGMGRMVPDLTTSPMSPAW